MVECLKLIKIGDYWAINKCLVWHGLELVKCLKTKNFYNIGSGIKYHQSYLENLWEKSFIDAL